MKIANTLKNIALACSILIASALPISAQNSTNKFSTNYDEWKRHSDYGKGIAKVTQPVTAYIDEKARIYEKNINRKEKIELAGMGYDSYNEEALIDLYLTHKFCHERIPQIYELVKGSNIQTNKVSNLEEAAFEDTVRLSTNAQFKVNLNNLLKQPKEKAIDCKGLSSIMFASYLGRLVQEKINEGNISLETGLLFHEEGALNGIGHQWIRIGDEIIDPAIRPDLGFKKVKGENYIPFIATPMYKKGEDLTGNTKILCFPKEIEAEIRKQLK